MLDIGIGIGITNVLGGGAASPYAAYTYAVDNVNGYYAFEQTAYASLAAMPGYVASPLTTNDPTLTESDFLIIAQIITGAVGATQFIFSFSNAGSTERILLYQTAANELSVQVISSGAVGHSRSSAAIGVGRTISLVLRRLSGVWSTLFIEAGAVLGQINNSDGNALPSSASMTKAALGEWIDGSLDFGGTLRGAFVRPGTYASDAAVIAALPLA